MNELDKLVNQVLGGENPSDQTEQVGVVEVEPETAQPGSGRGAIGGGLGALAILLLKFKGIIFIVLAKLKFLLVPLKFLKLGKLFTTFGSMIGTIAIDAVFFGWSYAVGFVMLIFVHEMGHVLAIRAKGLRAGAPVFIPFVGAMIAMKEMPHDAKGEAEIAIAGPLLGTLGAYLCFAAAKWTGSPLLMRLAYVGFMINLFNLLPVLPLDGGRIMAAISPKIWAVGMVAAVLLFFWIHNPFVLILVILSAGRMWHGLKAKPEELDYYNVPSEVRWRMTAAYFGLAGYLAFMLTQIHTR